MDLKQVFGEVLREIRKEKGISQEQLGFDCDFHRTYISLLERGEHYPSIKALFQIAKALGMQPSEILQRIENRKPLICNEDGGR